MTKLEEILAELEVAKLNQNFQKIVNILHFNKKLLSKRDSKVFDTTTFDIIESLIKSGFISNKMNREEELDSTNSYKNKLHHLIRFTDGVSRKSHLQLSFIPTKGDILFISDDGTMMSLCFGMYRDIKKLTAGDIDEILDSIENEYELDGTEILINSLRDWIANLDEQQVLLKYSLTDLLRETKMFDYFGQTKINYEVNAFTIKQHIKDQQNANLQPNPWIAHNFYKARMKAEENYETTFCGDRLQQDIFLKMIGVGSEPEARADRLFRNYANGSKKTEKDIPFYTTYGALLATNDLNDILKNNEMFRNYGKHDHPTFGSWWYSRYIQLVNEVTYADMVAHTQKFRLIQESGWADIVTAINRIIKKNLYTGCKAFSDLTPFKDDFGMYVVYVICSLHKVYGNAYSRTATTNIKRIKESLIKNLIDIIQKDGTFSIFTEDGNTNWDARYESVWKPAINQTVADMGNKVKSEKSFDKEVQHQKDSILKIVRDNNWGNSWTCFSHESDKLIQINLNEWSKTMSGLHCVPVDMGGTAEDGVIFGLNGDQIGKWKYINLNERFTKPSDYWESLGDRNSKMLEIQENILTESEKRRVNDFIRLCDTIAAEGIDYFCKK